MLTVRLGKQLMQAWMECPEINRKTFFLDTIDWTTIDGTISKHFGGCNGWSWCFDYSTCKTGVMYIYIYDYTHVGLWHTHILHVTMHCVAKYIRRHALGIPPKMVSCGIWNTNEIRWFSLGQNPITEDHPFPVRLNKRGKQTWLCLVGDQNT